MKILRSKLGAVAAGATIIAVVGGGGAYAASQITGSDIKNGTITSKDVKDKSLRVADLAPGARTSLKGARGPAGPKGATGPAGPQGPAGPAGQSLAANVQTPPSTTYSGFRVTDVTAAPAPTGATPVSGTALATTHVDAGTYLVTTTVQFFDLNGSGSDATPDYGAAGLSLGTTDEGTIWTPAIPHDGADGAQATGSVVVTVPSGGGDLTVNGTIHGDDDGQAGASLIVTKLDTPAAPTQSSAQQ